MNAANDIDANSSQVISGIPIRNIWLLMLYASDLYRDLGKGNYSVEEAPDEIPDLVAQMLCQAVEQRIRRNLSYGYQLREEAVSRVRGRINHLETKRKQLLEKGRVHCLFGELSVNTPRNRYAKAALDALTTLVKPDLSRSCASLAKQLFMMGVVGRKPDAVTMTKEVFGRHDIDDKQMVALAHLAFELKLPTQMVGNHRLQTPEQNTVFLRKLFEKGVAGLYAVSLRPKGWSVRAGTKLDWQVEACSDGVNSILPSMTTDITLENDNQQIVIDTKFNSVLTRGWYRDNTIRSGYLYQMYAYLRSQERASEPKSLKSTGILLHPCVAEALDEAVTIQGHKIRFVTVDLCDTASRVHDSLLQIVGSGNSVEAQALGFRH
ncbi:MAG: 5-methylcytosine-specific restriction endonuclease system specificity protein McrC [Oceanospirillaceae bacterium]|nr:5-methylcytosine-specific restriction endonuclease system specificity protein McrC [Oceanospirillaceae bacterium]